MKADKNAHLQNQIGIWNVSTKMVLGKWETVVIATAPGSGIYGRCDDGHHERRLDSFGRALCHHARTVKAVRAEHAAAIANPVEIVAI